MAHPSSTMPSRYIGPLKGFGDPNELIQRNIVELGRELINGIIDHVGL